MAAVGAALRGMTDFGEESMSRHLASVLRDGNVCYSPGLGWMLWDGIRWHRDPDREAIAVRREMLAYIRDWVLTEIMTLPTWAIGSLRRYMTGNGLQRLERMVKLAPGVTVAADRFDAIPNLLNTPDGVLDLYTGKLEPHDPSLFMTKVTGASYLEGTAHEDWDQALKALPDLETRKWLQCYLGRGLLGTQGGAEFVPFLIGGGSNGKSLIIGSCLRAIGDYGGMVADDLLAGAVHEEHKMRLRGLRLAVVEELADGHRLNVSRMKQIVGTDKMVGRHLYQTAVEWEPCHTLAVTSNYMPLVPETDHGTWRRLRCIPFPETFKPDSALKERLFTGFEQQQAVLAWLVEGALTEMPNPSEDMDKATSEWRMSVDLVAQFLDECCVKKAEGRVTRQVLLDRFNEFAESQGNRRLTGRVFTERFRSHKIVLDWNIEETKVAGERQWAGLALITPHLNGAKS